MNRLPNRAIVPLMLCLPAWSVAQVPTTPAPWQAVVDGIAVGDPFPLPMPGVDMQPLEYRRRPSQVALVVHGRDELTGTFCHGTMIHPSWMLTAASCVCSSKGEVDAKKMDVLLERETSTAPARRQAIVSSATDNRIWLYQTSVDATPPNCLAASPGSKPVDSAKDADLALVYLEPPKLDTAVVPPPGRNDETGGAIPGDLPVMDMLGTDTAPSSVLGSVAAGARASQGGDKKAESVVLAARTVSPSSAYPFLQSADIRFRDEPCRSPEGEVANVATSGAVTITRACANMTLGDGSSALQGLPGTGVALADHRRPLLLGVRGAAGTYTQLAQTSPTSGKTIAQSALDFIANHDVNDGHWFALQPPKPTPAPSDPCLMSKVATIDDVDIYQYKIMSQGVAYIYRQRNVWISVRGSPWSYHPKDPPPVYDSAGKFLKKGALDKQKNAGYPTGITAWQDVLARLHSTDPNPYVQNSEAPAPGYFVSMTSLKSTRFEGYDTHKYVDALTIPYVVMSQALNDQQPSAIRGDIGNFAAAISIVKDASGNDVYGKTLSGAIVADVNERTPIGGLSLELARRLNDLGKGRKLDADQGVNPALDVMFMVFPGTGSTSYEGQSAGFIDRTGRALLNKVKGWPPLSCFPR